MGVVNTQKQDYHMHSSEYSDGYHTVEELIRSAGDLGLDKIAITDHSDAALRGGIWCPNNYVFTPRREIGEWTNTINNVEVTFGIEGDVLNDEGDMCKTNQRIGAEFVTLSLHPYGYIGDITRVTRAYINAIKRNPEIQFICHPVSYLTEFLDIAEVVKAANDHGKSLEFNCMCFREGKFDLEKLRYMLEHADQIIINSDAHKTDELQSTRDGFKYISSLVF